VRTWLAELGVTTLFIEPASPWENGYIESFNGKLRDELLNGEIFFRYHRSGQRIRQAEQPAGGHGYGRSAQPARRTPACRGHAVV
jgi:transposase InsO family protein